MNRDTIQAYTNGILIGSGVADRYGEIATNDGIFFTSISDFFMYSVSEWCIAYQSGIQINYGRKK